MLVSYIGIVISYYKDPYEPISIIMACYRGVECCSHGEFRFLGHHQRRMEYDSREKFSVGTEHVLFARKTTLYIHFFHFVLSLKFGNHYFKFCFRIKVSNLFHLKTRFIPIQD